MLFTGSALCTGKNGTPTEKHHRLAKKQRLHLNVRDKHESGCKRDTREELSMSNLDGGGDRNDDGVRSDGDGLGAYGPALLITHRNNRPDRASIVHDSAHFRVSKGGIATAIAPHRCSCLNGLECRRG